MGCEDFRITLFADAPIDRVISELRRMPHVAPDNADDVPIGQEVCLTYDDGEHVFECEVRPDPPNSGTRISLRFALCHPPSIDAAFGAFSKELASRLVARIELADTVPEGMSFAFQPPDFCEFEETAIQATATKRRDWILDFGPETAAVLPEEAVRRFILKERQ